VRALAAVAVLGVACADPAAPVCDRPETFEKSPGPALEGTGWHRVYLQGAQAQPDGDGRYAMSEQRADILPSDHFLLSAGAYVEWTYPVISRPRGEVFLHIAATTDPDVHVRHQVWYVHAGDAGALVDAESTDDGAMGYEPFEGCFGGAPADGDPIAGDSLQVRVTNLTGGMLGVVTRPPDYFTWIDVAVE